MADNAPACCRAARAAQTCRWAPPNQPYREPARRG